MRVGMPLKRSFIACLSSVALAVVLSPSFYGAERAPQSAAPVEFNRDVRPILSDKCFACHGFDPKTRKGNLRLDTLEGATAEHDGSRAVVPGDVSKSTLWARVNHADKDEVMPPPETNKALSPAEKETLRRWIEQGAKYQQHWSFEPVRKVEPPKTGAPARNPVDAFL